MKVSILITSIMMILKSNGIPQCRNESIRQPFCVSENYLKNFPSGDENGIDVLTIIRVFSVVELDWTENTITLFLQLLSKWNDTRITVSHKTR